MCFNNSDQLRGVDVEESSSQVPTIETVCTIITAMVFFFLRFKHQVPFIRVKKPSLGWKRGGRKGGGGEIN